MDKKYTELSESSKKKLTSVALRLDKYNFKPSQIYSLGSREIAKRLHFKGNLKTKKGMESFEGLLNNIKALKVSKKRTQYITRRVKNELIRREIQTKKFRTKRAKRKAIKDIDIRAKSSSGVNIFYEIRNEMMKVKKISEKKANKRTAEILKNYMKIPRKIWKRKLSKKERAVLKQYGY